MIPVAAGLLFPKSLLARSLGSTLTAHAVGGAIWIYMVPMTPQIYATLVPIVTYERAVFAIGIAVTFIAVNALLSRLPLPSFVRVDRTLPLAA